MFKIIDGQRFSLTAVEIAENAAQEAAFAAQKPDRIREDRNLRLDKSDWTHTSDHSPNLTSEQVTAWATYRQELRDLPAHESWPDVEEQWPTEPE